MSDASADYFLNVPALLERVRKAVDEQLRQKGGMAFSIYRHAKESLGARIEGQPTVSDRFWLRLANSLVFPTLRRKSIGKN